MNDLQRKELELFKYFIDICEKLNLKYYLVCGSALGAVKYGGFIPWDDDLDVALLRPDYEKFIEQASQYLPEHIFLQNYRTDPEYPLLGSKLRDCNTTFIEPGYVNLNMNQGIYIDIFPLDGYPDSQEETIKFEKKKKYYERRRTVATSYNRWKYITNIRTTTVYVLYKLFGYCKDTAKTMKKYEEMISSYSTENSKLFCNHANWQGVLEYAPREQYGDGEIKTFEGIEVRVPQLYDAYLKQKYGDYMKELPEEEQVPSHTYIVDVKQPYTYYLKKEKRL